MCLETVDKRTEQGTGTGYKIFWYDGYYHLQSISQGSTRYKHETWYEDKNTRKIDATDGTLYPCGYHIFTDLEDARLYINTSLYPVRKVKYENIVASGKQANLKVVVAKRMYIFKGKIK